MAHDSGPGAGPVHAAVLDVIEPYLDAIADRIAERITAGRDRMINQYDSELGSRRHRAAVTRRLANGEGGAGRAGRNYLLTKEAIREELAGRGGRGQPSQSRGPSSPAAPAAAEAAPANDGSGSRTSRARELSQYERELIEGLRAVSDEPSPGRGRGAKGKG